MSFPPLASTADLAAYLKRELTAEEEALAELLFGAVSDVIRGRDVTGQIISRHSTTVRLVVDPDEQWVTLPQQPVVSVESVTMSDAALGDWHREGGRLYRRCGWYPSPASYSADTGPPVLEVAYTHGYEPVPRDVIVTACMWVDAASKGSMPVKSKSVGDYSVSYADVIPGTGLGMTLDALRSRYRVDQSGTVVVGRTINAGRRGR